jgi:hypothetical protein
MWLGWGSPFSSGPRVNTRLNLVPQRHSHLVSDGHVVQSRTRRSGIFQDFGDTSFSVAGIEVQNWFSVRLRK